MALHKYMIDYSKLSDSESRELIEKLERISFLGPDPAIGKKYCSVCIDANIDISTIDLLSRCNVQQIC